MMDIEKIRRNSLEIILNDRFDGNLKKLSEAIEKAQPYMHAVKTATRPLSEKLARHIELKLNLPYGYLDKNHDNKNIDSAIYISDFNNNVANSYAVDTKILAENGWKSEDLRVLRVTDNSMGPILITGMLVLVDTTLTEPENDLIYAIKSNSDIIIRRMIKQFGTDQFIAKPENMRHESYPYTPETQSIIGRVVYKLGEKL